MKKTLVALLVPGLLILFAPAVYAQDKHDCGKSADHLKKELKDKSGSESDLDQNVKEHMKHHPDGKCHCMCGHKRAAKKSEGETKKEERKCDKKKEENSGEKERKCHEKKEGEGDKKCERKKEEGEGDKKCERPKPPQGDKSRKGERPKSNQGEGDKKCHRPKPPPPPKKKCCCDGEKGKGTSGDKGGGSKGNNGVGNGEDPQPPGNPPQNDGSGTGKGNPGNKGGKGKGHK